ncbi:MAG: glutamate-1-semialdehyde 2,1-aminomutase [Lachnospiraceae bacterium]|nr:glutamate-1-semialdehyde 2,1-aminomutase [Lachnoclostridium sp.]MDD7520695.1 glutamate-1-semialdehyde 2,1-aminomutase [Lachnoclostridium sp.]MDY2599331.1 glutamate-1-semialdehyde 2,1-aminomutase [Lachnospiraceae bacterium]
MNTSKSKDLFEKSNTCIPGGVNSPVRAYRAVNRTPLFIEKGKGSHITDVDGNDYIDYVCSWGPGILGHGKDLVIEAVKEACDKGLTFGAPTEKEYEIAMLIKKMMPSMAMTRMVSSGTEAVMSAIRTARGFTGRDYIVKFRGCYHGHSDGLLVKAGSGALTGGQPDSLGVPADFTKYTLVAEYNSEESVENIFKNFADKIAAVVVEPVAANMGVVPPKEGFLQFLRNITDKYGSLLIFDEVITGFRLSTGGAQEYYGVEPDITTLGKIVGGGMPVGAYGGRKEIMEMVAPVGGVYQAGTLSGNPIAMTAGLTTLRYLDSHREIYDKIDKNAQCLEKAYREKLGNKVWINRVGSLMSVFFTPEEVKDMDSALESDTKAYADYFSYMIDNGIYIAPSQFEAMFISDAHGDYEISKTCEVIRKLP